MTTNKRQVGSKLADSVRQAKAQQTQQVEQSEQPAAAPQQPAKTTTPPPAVRKQAAETVTYLMPSKRVWPD